LEIDGELSLVSKPGGVDELEGELPDPPGDVDDDTDGLLPDVSSS